MFFRLKVNIIFAFLSLSVLFAQTNFHGVFVGFQDYFGTDNDLGSEACKQDAEDLRLMLIQYHNTFYYYNLLY